ADDEHEEADDDRGSEVVAPRWGGARSARQPIEERAGDREARPGHEQRRQRLDGVADGEVGRAPHDVHGREREDDAGARGHPSCMSAMARPGRQGPRRESLVDLGMLRSRRMTSQDLEHPPGSVEKPPGTKEFTVRAVAVGMIVAAIMGSAYP